jgi:rSAM/selenodomain-associated transferase 1
MGEKRIIVIFVKYPQRGRVKTRLARALGDGVAVGIYRNLVEYLIGVLRRVDADEVRVCFDPREKEGEIVSWLQPVWLAAAAEVLPAGPRLVFRPQGGGELGVRMESAFGEVFREYGKDGNPAPKVVAVGSDCIEIDGEIFRESWDALDSDDVVFGPARDGGYYLLGMKSPHRGLFENIPWSTEKTLEVSLDRAREAGLAIALLDKKHDIDTEEDWRRFEKMFTHGGTGQGDVGREWAE